VSNLPHISFPTSGSSESLQTYASCPITPILSRTYNSNSHNSSRLDGPSGGAVDGGGVKDETKVQGSGTAKNTQQSTPNNADTSAANVQPEAKDKEGPCGLPSKCSIL